MTNVLFSQFILRQVNRLETLLAKLFRDAFGFIAVGDLQTHEDMRLPRIANTVIEFRHRAWADGLTKATEAAEFFRNRHGEYGFLRLANLSAFSNKTQTIEIHIGATGNCDQRLIAQRFFILLKTIDISLRASNR